MGVFQHISFLNGKETVPHAIPGLIGLRFDPGNKYAGIFAFCIVVSPHDGGHVRVGGYNSLEIALIVNYDDLVIPVRPESIGFCQSFTFFHAPPYDGVLRAVLGVCPSEKIFDAKSREKIVSDFDCLADGELRSAVKFVCHCFAGAFECCLQIGICNSEPGHLCG